MRIAIITTSESKYIEVLAEAVKNKYLDVEIPLVITNKPNSRAIGVSRMYNIHCEVIDNRFFNDREEHDKEIMKKLDRENIDLVILTGYKRLIKNKEFLEKYSKGMINVYNSTLPGYPGMTPHITAFKEGAGRGGYTIHFISEFVDKEKIIHQEEVDIRDCKSAEQIYTKLVRAGCRGLLKVVNDFSIRALLMRARE